MKLIVAIAVMAALCVGTSAYAQDGRGHGGGHRGGGSHEGGHRSGYRGGHGGYHGDHHGWHHGWSHGDYDTSYDDGSSSPGYSGDTLPEPPPGPVRPKDELAPTKASWNWHYVEPPSKESIEAQKARDRNFAAAVADWETRNGRKIDE